MALFKAILAALVFILPSAVLCAPNQTASIDAASGRAATPVASEAARLEREKFEYQKALEEQKLEVERLKAWLTGGSILLPLLLGVITLAWQSHTATRLKDRDARDAFELKAAEIVFAGDNARATKNKAKALGVLFPGRLPQNFGDAFEPAQFGGPRFEAKLEVFKEACTKVDSPGEVYQVWHQLFPGDDWIKPLLPGTALKPDAGDEATRDG